MTPEQIADFVREAMKCASCEAVFHSIDQPHTDEDCSENNAKWTTADQEDIASELYQMLIESKEGQSDGRD